MEFVVDNRCLADLANGIAAVNNDFYQTDVAVIRDALTYLYKRHLNYKNGHFDPVDWRPREWSRGADFLASYASSTRSSGGTSDEAVICRVFGEKIPFQVYTDGGFGAEGGGFGIAVVEVRVEGNAVTGSITAFRYDYRPKAKSSFEMEVAGLTTAVSMMERALRRLPKRQRV